MADKPREGTLPEAPRRAIRSDPGHGGSPSGAVSMNSLSIQVSHRYSRVLATCAAVLGLLLASPATRAQALPVNVTVSGNHAEAVIGTPTSPIAEVILDFQDASSLSPASLGISAQQV